MSEAINGPVLRILGIRGIPAQHGGLETFTERLALYLVSQGWKVTVYCQSSEHAGFHEEIWNGIRLVHVPVSLKSAWGTVLFDAKSTFHAAGEKGLILTLGYNTALFCVLYRIRGLTNLINMDGIEWRRPKWSFLQKIWLYVNERLGCWLGNHLIADHPEIKNHLAAIVASDKITMIPYGAEYVETGDLLRLAPFGLEGGSYALMITRLEPENLILEIISAFSRKPRQTRLIIVGRFHPDSNPYHEKLKKSAGPDVTFLGPIYDRATGNTLRHYAKLYIHGHQVGGTNPSLVEALGASLPILAHDNKFNRWVADQGARYFRDEDDCSQKLDELLSNDSCLHDMKKESRKRFENLFRWEIILKSYELLCMDWLPKNL